MVERYIFIVNRVYRTAMILFSFLFFYLSEICVFFSALSLFLSVKLCFFYCVPGSCEIHYDLLLFVLNLVNLDFAGKSSDLTVRVESIGDIFLRNRIAVFGFPHIVFMRERGYRISS